MPMDLAMLNDKLARFARESESSLQASLQARDERIDKVEGKIDALTEMFKEYITSKRTDDAEGSNSARRPHPDGPRGRESSHLHEYEEVLDRGDRTNRYQDFNNQNQKVFLPRMDFPTFEGDNPVDWLENCDFYF